MRPSPETFVFTSELGARLRDLRLKAGLTQLELARAMGRGGKNAGNLASRFLEPQWIRLGLDTALAQRLAGVMLARFRELAGSFPPDPRPKR
jgi:transcriptional regulator with XRE-family HTH domain